MAGDPAAATAAYIDALGTDALAKAAAYTAGNHWLVLWGLAVTALVAWIVVRAGWLDRIAARLARRGPNLRAFLVVLAYFVVASLLALPWTLYEDWWRETQYGRTSQPLADALGQLALDGAIGAVLVALLFVGIYALLRRAGRRWWLWSSGLVAAGLTALLLLSPVLIEPLFNEYRPVPEGPVRDALLDMAGRVGVPSDRLFVYDGSRQSNNFTANVSGIGPAARIAISDVALEGAPLDEVKAVTAHEIGHYVLKHVWTTIAVLSLLALLAFYAVDRLYSRVARAFGTDAPLKDPRGVPIVVFLVSLLGVLAMPFENTLSRLQETSADRYSLETVDLPDALAGALVKTAEYRYPRPSPLQEFVFYTHPSVERRVRMAMEWKAARAADAER